VSSGVGVRLPWILTPRQVEGGLRRRVACEPAGEPAAPPLSHPAQPAAATTQAWRALGPSARVQAQRRVPEAA